MLEDGQGALCSGMGMVLASRDDLAMAMLLGLGCLTGNGLGRRMKGFPPLDTALNRVFETLYRLISQNAPRLLDIVVTVTCSVSDAVPGELYGASSQLRKDLGQECKKQSKHKTEDNDVLWFVDVAIIVIPESTWKVPEGNRLAIRDKECLAISI